MILSRFPVRDVQTVLYPRTGSGLPLSRPLGDERRGYMAATVDLPNGRSVRVFDTHITIDGKKGENDKQRAQRAVWQEQQVALLADAAKEHPYALVAGDFNVRPDSAALEALRAADFTEIDPKKMPTAPNKYKEPNSAAEFKIDYVFMKGFRPVRDAETYWVPSSDHRPLLTNITSSASSS